MHITENISSIFKRMPTTTNFLLADIISGNFNALNLFFLSRKDVILLIFDKLFAKIKQIKLIEFLELCFT